MHQVVNDGIRPNDVLALLAQIYLPLNSLTGKFAHNDLHTNNVLLYEPAPGKYIHFFYYFTSDKAPIEIRSKYVAKIIDYGQCFIEEANDIKKMICAEPECEPNCGAAVGFNFNSMDYWRSIYEYNPSIDLGLFHQIFPKMVTYGVGIKNVNDRIYGTKPNTNLMDKKGIITNISGAAQKLAGHFIALNNEKYYETQNEFTEANKYGEMHVYLNMAKPVQFVKMIH
jgi:hypothetical protein